jgi:2-iminobutanoate/2-iminopropanoate deaminase
MKKVINTPYAPAPIGPYSQAVLIGDLLYTSGQIAIDPKTGDLKTEDITTETLQVMENLKAILEAAGMNFSSVVKSSIFITDMNDFAKINAAYGSYFTDSYAPARETVQVAALPKYVHVEISMIAKKI